MNDPDTVQRPPLLLQGRYRVGPEIGRGGDSTVYRALDDLLGRTVAIKVFATRAIKPSDLRTQEGEARLLGSLNHPGLVTLLDAGVDVRDPDAPQVFLVMEHVDGPDLRQRLRAGALSALEVAYLGWDLLTALQYVHEHGIVHRDLKPANVLLTAAPGRPMRGKLADFGIAVLRGHPAESDGATIGTAAYLSPEQVEGETLLASTDIYSSGLVLLEALTARTAFPGAVVETALARLDRDPQIPEDLPPALADVLRRMTARTPDERPTAAEAVDLFRKAIVDISGDRPRVPDPEADRLAALHDYNLVDTAPDREFDRLTSMATRIFTVPVAVISIVGEDRVWLRSRQGVDITETERATGLGATGGLQDKTLVIEDVLIDPRTEHLPGARQSPYRFYAGVPLITRDGHNLGTFAIADPEPRTWSELDRGMLEDLAAIAMHEIEIRRAARRVATDALHRRG